VATVLAANVNRTTWGIQNQGTNPLFVLLGAGATTSVFHFVLKGGTALNDGNGGTYLNMDGGIYQGVVSQAGTAPTYTVWELQ
jgi:hypothetical protein